MPPFTPKDAYRHDHGADTGKKAHVWDQVASKVYDKTHDEGRAIREANAVIHKMGSGKKKS